MRLDNETMTTTLMTTTLMTPTTADEPITERDAAGRLGLKVATLRAWRHQGRGPAFVRLGRAIRYLPADLEDFLRANRHGSQNAGA